MAENGELTAKQRRMIGALLTLPTIGAACEAVGIGRTTLARWLRQPEFNAALARAEAEQTAQIARRLVGLGEEATDTLHSAMRGESTPTGAKIRAADIVLGRLLQLRELFTLEQRVTQLEERINAEKTNHETTG